MQVHGISLGSITSHPRSSRRLPISFTTSTAKFKGRVTVLYDRGGDAYVVELHRDGELVDRYDEVYFDMLGAVLERLIDDGRWRLLDVSVIDTKAPRQRQAVTA